MHRVPHQLLGASHAVLQSLSTTRILAQHTHKVCFSKVPENPTWTRIDPDTLPKAPEIDLDLVRQLERISLVEFGTEEGLHRLQEAVKLANQMRAVDTEGIEPMYSVLEDRECYLREDLVTDGDCVEQVTSNASKMEENYFVAPPGNIAMKSRDNQHLKNVLDARTESDNGS